MCVRLFLFRTFSFNVFIFYFLSTRFFLFVHPRDNKESRQVEIAQFHLSWQAKEMIRLQLQFGKLGGTAQDKNMV